jgi:hypothetical protein
MNASFLLNAFSYSLLMLIPLQLCCAELSAFIDGALALLFLPGSHVAYHNGMDSLCSVVTFPDLELLERQVLSPLRFQPNHRHRFVLGFCNVFICAVVCLIVVAVRAVCAGCARMLTALEGEGVLKQALRAEIRDALGCFRTVDPAEMI